MHRFGSGALSRVWQIDSAALPMAARGMGKIYRGAECQPLRRPGAGCCSASPGSCVSAPGHVGLTGAVASRGSEVVGTDSSIGCRESDFSGPWWDPRGR
jgi:hypothetical protein